MITRIGILGGTFDPVHNGHLYVAEKVLARLCLDKIIFIPTYLPPHKNIIPTPARHRYNMVRLAIANHKKFEVSQVEIKRKGKSYSVETLYRLKKKYGRRTEMFFITGSDSLPDLYKWKRLRKILELAKFVVVKRPGFVIKNPPRRLIIIDIKAKDISASRIRKRVSQGRVISKLVPVKVRDYIKQHKLYSTVRGLTPLL